MAKISQYFKDKAKTIKDYPKTLIKAVYGDDGKRLDNIISDITSDIDSTKAKIGTTDISKYGDGTLTGGLDALNSKLGNTDISAIGDGTVTGGLNVLNSNLIEIQTVSGTLNTDDSWLNVSLPSGFTSQNSVVVGIKVFWYSDLYISTQYLSEKEKYECYYSSLNSFSIRGLDSDTQGKTFYVSFMKLKN